MLTTFGDVPECGEMTSSGCYDNPSLLCNSVVSYAHQRETSVSSNDSLQVRPFSKWELLLRKEFAPRGGEKFAPRGNEFFPLRAVP